MKKYISLMVIAIVAILSSCSNDDITITTSYTFNVNASGVVSPFFEAQSGELEKFEDATEKVRIRLLVYNANGELVAQESNCYSNYNTQLKTSKLLAAGNYTVIGISDVVYMSGNSVKTEFWKLSGESKLSELKIIDGGFIGLEAKILGLAKYSLTIGDNQSSSLNVDLQPAGALLYCFVWKPEGWVVGEASVDKWDLYANKIQEGLSFDASGNNTVIEKNHPDSIYTLARLDAKNIYTYNGNLYLNYTFSYVLPMNKLEVYFLAKPTDGNGATVGKGTTLNLKAGDEYACHLDMYGGKKDYYKLVNSNADFNYPGSSSSARQFLFSPRSVQCVDKLAPMPKTLYNQTKHVVTAADIALSIQ